MLLSLFYLSLSLPMALSLSMAVFLVGSNSLTDRIKRIPALLSLGCVERLNGIQRRVKHSGGNRRGLITVSEPHQKLCKVRKEEVNTFFNIR